MGSDIRESGVDILGNIPWGTHICQFYQTKEDLIDTLVPYFKAGLESNEFCMWVTAEPLQVRAAKVSLGKEVPGLDDYLKKGQMEIIDYSEWYTRFGKFDASQVLEGWIEKEKTALESGFDGLRLSGSTFWVEETDWSDFTAYEAVVDSVIGRHKMIALCTYSLDRCNSIKLIEVVSNHEVALIRKDGCWVLLESANHRKTEEALRKSEQNFRSSMDDSPFPILINNERGEVKYANMAMIDLFGYTGLQDFTNIPYTERYSGGTQAILEAGWRRRREGLFVSEHRINEISRANGEIRLVEVFSKKILWNGEELFEVLFYDITERRQAEQALQNEKQRAETYLNAAGVIMVMVDTAETITMVNRKACEILGFSDEQLIGKNWFDTLVPEREREARRATFRKIISGELEINAGEDLLLTSSGSEILGAFHNVTLRDPEGNIIGRLMSGEDITERKQMEAQLRHSQVLASLGEMTAGIAHEVGNPLASIILYSEVAMRGDDLRQVKRDLKVIHNEAKRAGTLMKDLLAYSRKLGPNTHRVNVHRVIAKVIKMRQYQEKVHGIRIATNLLKGTLNVSGDAAQLTQVFMNLILNAGEALKGRGKGNIRVSTSVDTYWVKVSICDDGPGIPEEYLDQIFMPFFTTKDVGEGTGLGLSTCYGIITSHGGTIIAENNETGGATFIVALPLLGKGWQEPLPLEVE